MVTIVQDAITIQNHVSSIWSFMELSKLIRFCYLAKLYMKLNTSDSKKKKKKRKHSKMKKKQE